MPGFPFPGRPGGEHDEPLLDMIIARRALPPDAPQEMHDLARMLAALTEPAQPGELAAEPAVRAAFSRAAFRAGLSSAARRPVRHRRTRRSRRLARSRGRLATALVVAAAGLGGAVAAYAGVLPGPIQQAAHVTIAAPPPQRAALTGSATSGAGQTAARQARAAKSQRPATPHHPARPTPASSPAQAPRAHPMPSYSPVIVHPTTGSTCGSSPWYPQGQSHGSPTSWPSLGYCGSSPTARPTAAPTVKPSLSPFAR